MKSIDFGSTPKKSELLMKKSLWSRVGCVQAAWQPCMFRWPLLDVSTSQGVGPQVNKFEQVSSDDHQMSPVGGRSLGLMSEGEQYPTYP